MAEATRPTLPGIHHGTAIRGEPQRTVGFGVAARLPEVRIPAPVG